jgi:hypothetical protein
MAGPLLRLLVKNSIETATKSCLSSFYCGSVGIMEEDISRETYSEKFTEALKSIPLIRADLLRALEKIDQNTLLSNREKVRQIEEILVGFWVEN